MRSFFLFLALGVAHGLVNEPHSENALQPDGGATTASGAAAPAQPESPSHIDSVLISQIFVMCVVMYGGIALLWGLNLKAGVSSESYRIALLCISWASMSVGMHVLNKALVGYLGAPAIIAAFQMMLSVLVVGAQSWQALRDSPPAQLLRWLVVPAFFAGMLISSFYAYERISLTLLTLVRNITPMLMLPLEIIVMPADKRPVVTMPVVAGLFTMLLGALVYTGGNFEAISMVGVAFAFLNMVLAVTDRLLQRRLLIQECKDLSSATCTIVNNGFGMVPTLLLAMSTGELMSVPTAHPGRWVEAPVMLLLLASGLVGTGICIFGLECQRAISATSFSIMQNASKVAVVGCGVMFFSDPINSMSSVLGLLMSLGGSLLYSWAQQQASQPKKLDKLVEAPDMGTPLECSGKTV